MRSKAAQNWAHGPVRSGKNYALNIRFTEALQSEPKGFEDADVAFCGASKTAIYRVFLKDLFAWVGTDNYRYNSSDGSGRIFNRDFYSFGYRDADSHERISGSTFGLAYMTEGIYANEDFHKQLMGRLSLEDELIKSHSMLFGDTNPAGPQHWLWKKVINNRELLEAGDVAAFPFSFETNRFIKEAYRARLKRLYKPGSLWYQRMIEGRWVMAEGIVYGAFRDGFNTCRPDQLPKKFDELVIAVDFGTNNPFAALLIGIKDGFFYVIDEYYHSGRDHGQRTNLQYADELVEWIGSRSVDRLYIDPSAASFKAELDDHAKFQDLGIWVHDAENEVLDGIHLVDKLFYVAQNPQANCGLIISTLCSHTLEELGCYIWDVKACERGNDKPIKKNDHCMDALRYALLSQVRRVDNYSAYGIAA